MKSSKELTRQLQENAQSTPYVITPTDNGFSLTINIVDKQWYTLLFKNGLKKVFTIDAALDESSHKATTTDTLYELDWQGGTTADLRAPQLRGKLSAQSGEVWSLQAGKQYGVSEEGKVGAVASYNFSSVEAKQWLDTQLSQAGWHREMGKQAKGALIFVIIVIIVTVIGVGAGLLLQSFR